MPKRIQPSTVRTREALADFKSRFDHWKKYINDQGFKLTKSPGGKWKIIDEGKKVPDSVLRAANQLNEIQKQVKTRQAARKRMQDIQDIQKNLSTAVETVTAAIAGTASSSRVPSAGKQEEEDFSEEQELDESLAALSEDEQFTAEDEALLNELKSENNPLPAGTSDEASADETPLISKSQKPGKAAENSTKRITDLLGQESSDARMETPNKSKSTSAENDPLGAVGPAASDAVNNSPYQAMPKPPEGHVQKLPPAIPPLPSSSQAKPATSPYQRVSEVLANCPAVSATSASVKAPSAVTNPSTSVATPSGATRPPEKQEKSLYDGLPVSQEKNSSSSSSTSGSSATATARAQTASTTAGTSSLHIANIINEEANLDDKVELVASHTSGQDSSVTVDTSNHYTHFRLPRQGQETANLPPAQPPRDQPNTSSTSAPTGPSSSPIGADPSVQSSTVRPAIGSAPARTSDKSSEIIPFKLFRDDHFTAHKERIREGNSTKLWVKASSLLKDPDYKFYKILEVVQHALNSRDFEKKFFIKGDEKTVQETLLALFSLKSDYPVANIYTQIGEGEIKQCKASPDEIKTMMSSVAEEVKAFRACYTEDSTTINFSSTQPSPRN